MTRSQRFKDALIRAARTFIAAAIVVYPAPALIGVLAGHQPLDLSALRAAGVAGGVAVVSWAWRMFLDPSPIPSLCLPSNPPAAADAYTAHTTQRQDT